MLIPILGTSGRDVMTNETVAQMVINSSHDVKVR
jgi:hypothetical protein